MNARTFAIVNAVGCLLLAGFIVVQWVLGAAVEKDLRESRAEAAAESDLRREAEKHAVRLQADVDGLKASLDSIRADAEEKAKSFAAEANQSEELHTGLVQAQEQMKVMDEAIKARDEALKSRDAKLKELGDGLVATRKRLDEAVVTLKQAGAKAQ